MMKRACWPLACFFLLSLWLGPAQVGAAGKKVMEHPPMYVVIGLGNPGAEYEKNRHNAGFMMLDALHAAYGTGPWRAKFQGLLAEAQVGGEKVLLFKPQTYMNLSGHAVGALLQFYKVDSEKVIVAYDELDVALGDIKVRDSGGAGGHNGIKSLQGALAPNFVRLRLGIGHPGHRNQVTNYVLGNFTASEGAIMTELIDEAERNFPLLLAGNRSQFIEKIKTMMKEK